MGESSASYIHMVQYMIEKCLIFHMNKEECIEALSKHANIMPVITSTVWNELEKANREFFQSYYESSSGSKRMSETETSVLIEKIISENQSNKSDYKDQD
ncbi:hypothetical protein M8C21_023684 [Ambrosia artemisiifolia]|uniref:Angiotensin-converting enzyme 2 n=1 Tax=Ambrosia artemisiifolia TaxID=4212 RepID=A0AAD5GGL6_AMBAR|nr:hypothetical protein M8C21_023684 [Ambrosia artemisiifolia]